MRSAKPISHQLEDYQASGVIILRKRIRRDLASKPLMILTVMRAAFTLGLIIMISGCSPAPTHRVSESTHRGSEQQTPKDLGEEAFRERNHHEALEHFKAYAEQEPGDWYAFNRLGWVYYHLEEVDLAIANFKRSNELSKRGENYQGLVWCYQAKGDYDTAIHYMTIFSEINAAAGH